MRTIFVVRYLHWSQPVSESEGELWRGEEASGCVFWHPSFDPKSSLHFFANLNLDKPIVMEKSCDFAIISPTGEAIEKEELTKDLLDWPHQAEVQSSPFPALYQSISPSAFGLFFCLHCNADDYDKTLSDSVFPDWYDSWSCLDTA